MASPTRRARRALAEATTYAAWREAAEELDHLTGAAAWRDDDASPDYHSDLVRDQLDELRSLREHGDAPGLVDLLHHSLHRNLGDLAAPGLYDVALAGTKRLVTAYLDETERALAWLRDIPGVPNAVKLGHFRRANHAFGRSALMLSGGATLGFYHLGVVKALWSEGVLPDVITGASTGAMIAAGVCARTDAELGELFDDVTDVRRDGLDRFGLRDILRNRAVLDPAALRDVLDHNVGPWTFEEAHARSGRVLAIAVSPTRARQKPRLLTHTTAPDVLVASGALASSAVPGLFPPVVLERRDRNGAVVPYIPTERWIDGSVRHDLPMMRLSRLHNVNHFIVSQTNPHVLPFLAARSGPLPVATGVVASTVRAPATYWLDVARRVTGSSPLRPFLDHAWTVAGQDYRGDIDIHPRLRPAAYLRLVANPTLDELHRFILEGQRAAWPKIEMIRDHTRIGRLLGECVRALEARVGAAAP